MTSWAKSWNCRCATRKAAREKAALKREAHRRARRTDGVVRLNSRDVI
jgi:hypothetical protein